MSRRKLPLVLFLLGCVIEAVGIGVFAFRALPVTVGVLIMVAGIAMQVGAFVAARRFARASHENSSVLDT